MAEDDGLKATMAAFDRLRRKPREAIGDSLIGAGNRLAAAQKFAAPKDTGALADSITVTKPGARTPAYSQPGGSRVAGETEVIVTAGDHEARYVHLVEYGTAHAEAQPFFWPAYRLLKRSLLNKIRRDARKALRDAWKGVQ